MMNILVLSWRGPKHPLSGGAEQVMHEHMKGWIEAGHAVTLFTSNFPGGIKEETLDGVRIIRSGSQYLTVHINAFFWYLKNKKFDLIVDQFHGWPFFTPLYVGKPKLAVIQELTRSVWFRYPLPYGLNYILGTIGYLIEPLFFLFYKNVHFMTGSESAKKELQTVGIKEKQITIVPHGVIVEKPKKQFGKEKKKTVMYLGALASDKGIEDAIKTFSELNKKGDYQFWVVGKGDENYLKHLKNITKELGIEKNTTFFGFVSQEKKFELLQRAHVMINPSIREGWGLVNIEANAMGTPVIAYASPGLVDSVSDGVSGAIVKKNEPICLSNAVEKILNDLNLYKKISKSSIDWANGFNWSKSKKLSLNLLDIIYKRNK